MDELLLDAINRGDVEEVARLISQIELYQRYNKLHFWHPYPYQQTFINKSAEYRQRYARSGNRTGKTNGAAAETAMHLTGLYPDWYQGERLAGSDRTFWCIGIDNDSTSKVMQKELFGTADIRVEEEVGTGFLPLDTINVDYITKDGPRVVSCRIKHVDGGYNTLYFYAASNGQDKLMGQAVSFVWMDEIPRHNAMEIYSQCVTRLATTNGHIMVTGTPEAGYDDFNRHFAEDKTGKLYLQSVSMYEAPHLTHDIIEELKAGWPEWQWSMRINGLPVLGSGAVFPIPDSEIMCEDITPLLHWPIVAGVDFASVNDKCVIAYSCHDVDNDVYYLFKADVIDNIEDKSPEHMAELILNGPYPNVPVVVPHDGGINSASPESKAKIMMRMGVNVQSRPFYNASIMNISIKGHTFTREPGLTEMRHLMKHGKFKVCHSIPAFFEEKAQLFYSPASGGGLRTVGKDDVLDATRYSVISLVGNRGIPAGQCLSSTQDFNNGFVNTDECHLDWD